MTAALLWAGVVGPPLFVVTFAIDGATRPGYRPSYHPVSALALGPRGWIQTANFLVTGVLVTAGAIGTWLALDAVIAPALLTVFGLAVVGSGVFPMDAMRCYPPGTPRTTPTSFSFRHRAHDAFGAVVFGLLPVTCVAFAIALPATAWRIYSGATAVVLAALVGIFSTGWERDTPHSGLWQRAAIVVGWTWIALVCLHLLGVDARP